MALGPPVVADRRLAWDDVEGDRGRDVKLVLEGEVGMERCGDAPRRPMMHGSRWWSWGMALKRWVISRAPLTTAAVLISVDAILDTEEEEE